MFKDQFRLTDQVDSNGNEFEVDRTTIQSVRTIPLGDVP